MKQLGQYAVLGAALGATDISDSSRPTTHESNDSHRIELTESAKGNENNENIELLKQDLESRAQNLESQADSMKGQLLDFFNPITVAQAQEAAKNLDQEGVTKAIETAHAEAEGHEDGSNKMVLFISFLGLAYFANMMYRCARYNEPISFIKHHAVFVGGLLAMGTQLPHEIAEGLKESVIAFAAIMAITRVSRGIVSKGVDFTTLNDEEAKAVIFSLGWFGSLFNSLSTATALAPLAGRLERDEDRYIAMQNIGNIDGGVGLGAFPGLVAINKLGMVNGPLFQLGLMLPVMVVQKLWQAVLWRPNLVKHAGLIGRVIKGMRFEGKQLGQTYTHGHEHHQVEEIVEELKRELEAIKDDLGPDYAEILAALDDGGKDLLQEFSVRNVEDFRKLEQYQTKGELTKDLEKYLEGPEMQDDMAGIASAVLSAMRDGLITKEELQAIESGADLDKLMKKAPKSLTESIGLQYERFLNNIAASHNEREILRVFTVQAMAVPLLIPAVESMLHQFPVLTEAFTGTTTAFADNYAAAAMTWGVDPAKALSVAIVMGGGTIYGNMPNLNFLGAHANLANSIKSARYLIPTAIFLLAYLNLGPKGLEGKSFAMHSAEFAQNIPAMMGFTAAKVEQVVNEEKAGH